MKRFNAWSAAAALTIFVSATANAAMTEFYLPTRYYDAAQGRFISADTEVQDSADPQSRNRNTYVRNNPITHVDPTGHSWLSESVPKVVPFVNPFIAPSWTVQSVKDNREAYIAGGVGYVTSGGNPVVAAAAFATEMGMQTGAGRKTTNHVAQGVFVNVFGMDPRTAYIFANITLRMASIAAMERAWLAVAPNQLQAVPLSSKPEDIEGGSAGPASPFGPSAANGSEEGARGEQYYALLDQSGDQVGTAMDRPLQAVYGVSSPLQIDHTGINVTGYDGGSVPGPLYGSWGVCHTAVNRTLFQAGYGSTVSSLGIGGWSTNVTSVIYGNYGGGLYRAAYWGYDANN